MRKLAAAVIWGLAIGAENRKRLVAHDVVSSLETVVSTSFASDVDDAATVRVSIPMTRCTNHRK